MLECTIQVRMSRTVGAIFNSKYNDVQCTFKKGFLKISMGS